MKKFVRLAMATVVSMAVLPVGVAAADVAWPGKQPITMLVPSGAGSSPDTMVRVVAEEAGKILQQTIVVQNRPGASGNLGTNLVAKAPADGYTLGVSFTGPLVNNSVISKSLPYNPFKDLTPLTLAAHQYNVLVVPASSSIKSLADLVEASKRPDAKLNFPTTGAGTVSHLAVELLMDRVGGKALHVPYQSSPSAVTSLLSGDTNFAALPPVAVMPMIKDGRLRAIAAVSAKRLSFLPDVPTTAELGYAGVEGSGWIGFIAPAGLPADVQNKLHSALVTALKNPQVEQRLQSMYMEAAPQTSAEFAQYMQEELKRWGPLIKRLDLVEK